MDVMEFQLDIENEVNIGEDRIIWTETFVLNANNAVRRCWSLFHYYNAKPDQGYFREKLTLED